MKSERKSTNRDSCSHNRALSVHKDKQLNRCKNCKSVPKTKVTKPQQSKNIKVHRKLDKKLQHNQNKSLQEDPYEHTLNDESTHKHSECVNLVVKRPKRQSNSYCKPNLKIDQSQDSLIQEDSLGVDHFLQKKYKQSQNDLMDTKTKLYKNECQVESLDAELRKIKRENKLLQEKTQHLENEVSNQTKKCLKYKQIAKGFKINLDQIEKTLSNLKRLSQDEINSLRNNVKLLEKMIKQKSFSYQTNLRTITSYLQRIQKMIQPSDHNYSFNNKILFDLMDLCNQLQQMSNDEDQKLMESLASQKSKSNIGDQDFLLSQTSFNDINETQQKQLSAKTQRLLEDYEKMKYESENLRKENAKLKKSQGEKQQQIKVMKYDSRNSQKSNTKKNQSLSVADLMQYDSVQQLNSKLENKNKRLEDQLSQMKDQMSQLALQTKEMYDEREQFKNQIVQQNDYIMQLINQNQAMSSNNTNSHDKQSEAEDTYRFNYPRQSSSHSNNYMLIDQTKKLFSNDYQTLSSGGQETSPSERMCATTESDYKIGIFDIDQKLEVKDNGHVSFKKKTNRIPSQASSNIDSYRQNFSKQNSDSRQNVFRRNCYLESDKENINSYRDNNSAISFQGTAQKNNKIVEYENKTFNKQPANRISDVMSSTSPLSVAFSKNDQIIMSANNRNGGGSQTLRKPMSMGSTTTLVMNEKAKVLKDEISTLDSEIQQLQQNLKRAIQKREVKHK